MNTIALRRACCAIALCWVAGIAPSHAADSVTDPGKLTGPATAVYVDGRTGRDTDPGTRESPVHSIARAAQIIRSRDNATFVMKLNPGIHVLAKHVALATEKELRDQRLVVEASTLPDDPAWTPEAMPIVLNSSGFSEIQNEAPSFVASFLVEASHVTIRGIKFHGYPRANSRYFPIARFDKTKTDLLVEQCLFVADPNAAHIQVGVIAHGNGVKVHHCVFYQAGNAVVFWQDGTSAIKSGNSLTHSIIVGAGQSAVWTAWPDQDFAFNHNIVTRCKHVWVRNAGNPTPYAMANCVLVENQHPTGIADKTGVRAEPFDLRETDIQKSGEITLRLVDALDQPLPRDYLHPLPGTLGHDLNAGLFKK